MKKHLAILFAATVLVGSTAEAGRQHRCCQPAAASCAPAPCCATGCSTTAPASCPPQMGEHTIMEPVMTTEIRKVKSTEYRQEPRERKYTVQRIVPRTETRTRTVGYTENETRTREEKYTESRPVTEMI